MKIILKSYSDSSNFIEFDRESGFFTNINKPTTNIISGYFEIYDNKCFAFYNISNARFFFDGLKEMKLTSEYHTSFINAPNDSASSFFIYKNGALIFEFTYEAWWSSFNAFKPDLFIIEARQQDIEYDLFAYINTYI